MGGLIRRSLIIVLLAALVLTAGAQQRAGLWAGLVAVLLVLSLVIRDIVLWALSPTKPISDFLLRRALWIMGFMEGAMRGAEISRMGDLVRNRRGLSWLATPLDGITYTFHAAAKRVGPERMAAGRSRFKARMSRRVDSLCRLIDLMLTPKAVVGGYLFLTGAVFLVLVSGFAVAYLAAWKLDKAAFSSGLPVARGLWSTWFFSITTITTSGISPLAPQSRVVQALASLELVCGVLVVTILITAFSLTNDTDLEARRAEWHDTQVRLRARLTDILDRLAEVEREHHSDGGSRAG